jgi:ketosteroid isomerase-like protein
MSRKETALAFVQRFCRADVAGLRDLLSDDFRFSGPFLVAASREAYLAELTLNPPEPAEFKLLAIAEEGEVVAVFYEYAKPGHSAVMGQLCRFRDDRIAEIVLVFDSREFE